MLRRIRQRFAHALDRRVAFLGEQVAAEGARTREDVARLRREVGELEERVSALESLIATRTRLLAADEPAGRRRVERARRDPAYERAFSDDRPLVSICIPTFDRIELLLERSLPSVLEQTYRNIEVIVIGDAAAPAVGEAVRAVLDPRVRFLNLTHRIDYGSAVGNWQAGSAQARNLGYSEARGLWISDFDDDDALRPDAIEQAVAYAQEHRFEAVFGRLNVIAPDGGTREIGVFPPRLGEFSWQGGVVHHGLRAFAREHAAAVFGIPQDWERAERMLRAGVRFGMLDRVLADLYPSTLWGRAPKA